MFLNPARGPARGSLRPKISSRSLAARVLPPLLAIALVSFAAAAPKPYGLSQRTLWTGTRVIGSPEPPSPYTTRRAFPRLIFDRPTLLTSAPGTSRLFIADLDGRIFSFEDRPGASEKDLFLDLGWIYEPKTGRKQYRRIVGLAFHPDFQSNGYFFVCTSERYPKPVRTRIARYEVLPGDPLKADPDSELIVLEFPSNGHNGGSLKFGHDGYLYISTGDGFGQSDPMKTGQFTGDLLASILRIDINGTHSVKPYAIPPDNPFINTPGTLPEIFAFGFRQPWKISFDSKTGDLWTGEVGQDLWESIFLVKRGGNYGWSVKEGSQWFRPERPRGPAPFSPPVVSHSHGEARSITGGFVYRGSRLAELYGAYIYADWETGKIWALRYDGEKVTQHDELADTAHDYAAFGETNERELYLLTHRTGEIHELLRRPKTQSPRDHEAFPRLLSETGLFSSVAGHIPAPGVLPYSVNSPLWSDGAYKERFIALPGQSQIRYLRDDRWLMPEGAVLVKTFSIEMEEGNPASRKRLETRLLTLQSGPEGREQWAGYIYLWNDQQTDAKLLGKAALRKTYSIRDARAPDGVRQKTWYYPSRADCMICHNEKAGFVLGLNTLQMNRDHDYPAAADNQLRTFEHIGMFAEPLPAAASAMPHLVDPADPGAPLERRVRSYLHANCAHCHRRGGGGNADLQLLYGLPLDETATLNTPPLHGDMGADRALLLAPGDPEQSVLYRRMKTTQEGRMPHIGSLEPDHAALALLKNWILGLPR